jgi:hypothetical protein
MEHNIIASFALMGFLFQFTLRKHVILNQSWKKIMEVWLKWTGVSVVTIGGFEAVAYNTEINANLLKIVKSSSIADIRLMTTITLIIVATTIFAWALTLVGHARAKSEDTNIPIYLFIPVFLLAWISITGSMSLVLCNIMLTIHAHLMTQG